MVYGKGQLGLSRIKKYETDKKETENILTEQ